MTVVKKKLTHISVFLKQITFILYSAKTWNKSAKSLKFGFLDENDTYRLRSVHSCLKSGNGLELPDWLRVFYYLFCFVANWAPVTRVDCFLSSGFISLEWKGVFRFYTAENRSISYRYWEVFWGGIKIDYGLWPVFDK